MKMNGAKNGRAKGRSMIEAGVNDLGKGKIGKPVEPKNAVAVSMAQNTKRLTQVNPPQPGYAVGGRVRLPKVGPTIPNLLSRAERPGGMKKGGKAQGHDDEKQDVALIKKLMGAVGVPTPGLKTGGKAKKFAEGGPVAVPRSMRMRQQAAGMPQGQPGRPSAPSAAMLQMLRNRVAAAAAQQSSPEGMPPGLPPGLPTGAPPPGMKRGGKVKRYADGGESDGEADARTTQEARALLAGGMNNFVEVANTVSPATVMRMQELLKADPKALSEDPPMRRYAAGGVAKIRHGQATPAGAPKAPKAPPTRARGAM